jgi:hypothetical protein
MGEDFFATFFVQENIQSPAGTDAMMVVTLGTDIQIRFQLGPVKHGVALNAFFPETFRYGAAATIFVAAIYRVFPPDNRGNNFIDPAHDASCC